MTRFLSLFLVVFFSLSFAGSARSWQIETRFGVLRDVPVNFDPTKTGSSAPDSSNTLLMFRDQFVKDIVGWFDVVKIIEWNDENDVVLLHLWSGGAHCCHSYRLLRLGAATATLSNEFGRHMIEPSEFEVTPTDIRFRLLPEGKDSMAGELFDHMEVDFDGAGLVVRMIPLGIPE